ncbi:hypothetical protein DSM3645_04805 [Blastopirellula marina DSM 3645]|uniref:Uncharacterized protein n=2 Tax=Blastopirellula marina TaxID=124 RepID=A4A1N5_9BACT|nr:hypothetical protein DSM3645_04805 [Blastopirellula marina DSM 3645]
MAYAPSDDKAAPYTSYLIDSTINSNYLARAAVFGDSTRLAPFANGMFLPSAIPVAGQPYYGTNARASLQGNGSALRLSAYSPATSSYRASAHADLVLDNAELSIGDNSVSTGFAVRSVVGTINGFTIGVSDSAFSDPSAVPETIDIAGPSARVTVFDAGITNGQGRLSYDFFSQREDGFKAVASIEQPIPEISYTAANESRFAYLPDFIFAPQYVVGDCVNGKFVERWHVQLGSVFRSLALETPAALDESEFGWGLALSGAYRMQLNPALTAQDRVMFSITYGEGISHYIVDLNAAPDTGDAMVNTSGSLEALPVFACYGGYTHNWTDDLRSTITYSHVDLHSTAPRAPATSPYRAGDYVAVNLVSHLKLFNSSKPDSEGQNMFLGTEYLYGRKETLDGATGDAHRLMLVFAISN